MRPLQYQLQDLADWIAYIELDPRPTSEDFSEGMLRAAWRAIANIPDIGDRASFSSMCQAALRDVLGACPDGPRLFERILRIIPSDRDPFKSLEEVAPELPPVEWLWRQWLPARMLTFLAARPGEGKSLVSLDLAGRVMSGAAWPDGSPASLPPANVIYVDGESIPQVHNERAEAWALPRNRLYMLVPEEEDITLDLGSAKYQELLLQMVCRIKPALVIVDSLASVLSKGENAVEDVRGVLGFLAGMAQQYGPAVLAVHHLRKGLSGQVALTETVDLDQLRGSGHIGAMGRVVLGLSPVQTGPQPDPHGPRKLQVIKSNLARRPRPLGVRFERLSDAPEGDEQVLVAYDPEAPEPYREPAQRSAAQEWLLDYLAGACHACRHPQRHCGRDRSGFQPAHPLPRPRRPGRQGGEQWRQRGSRRVLATRRSSIRRCHGATVPTHFAGANRRA